MAMAYFKYLRFLFSFRVIAASLLVWLLFMTQAQAWNQATYAYQQPYRSIAYSSGYQYPPSNYYRSYYPAIPAYNADSSSQAPTDIIKPQATENLQLKQRAKQKIKAVTKSLGDKKQVFINNLLPFIERENARIRQIRKQASDIIHDLDSRYSISEKSSLWLKQLGKKYRIKGDPTVDKQARGELLKKVDIIPASLTLAQAANESAWGKSRFATQANNLFGIWTYDEKKGLIPQNRDSTKKHLVRKFDDLGGSVRYYMHMLNSHPAYQKLREVRYQLRQNQQSPDGHALAVGLEKYSAKGDIYIKLIRDLIRQNQWARLDELSPAA